MSTVNVFISYADADRKHRDKCMQALRRPKSGGPTLRVFDDKEGIPLGGRIPSALAAEIDQSDVCVVLLSDNYLAEWKTGDRNWRRDEWQQLKERVYVIPVLLRECLWKSVLPEIGERSAFPSDHTPIGKRWNGTIASWPKFAEHVRALAMRLHSSDERREHLGTGADPMPTLPGDFLRRAASLGLLTPVLGAGCYETMESRKRGEKHVHARRDVLLDVLQNELEPTEAKLCREYVTTVVHDSLTLGDESSKPPVRRTSFGPPPKASDREGQVLDLQISVVRASVRLIRHFGQAMAANGHGISNADRYHLLVTLEQAEAAELFGLLREAATLADAIADGGGKEVNDSGLGARGIANQLKGLVGCLQVEKCEVYLTELEWLADLLWHLIRHDAPMYPNAEELGFQLGVCATTGMPRRRAPASAVAPSLEDADQLIGLWFRSYGAAQEAATTPVPFYSRLAEALCVRLPVPGLDAVKPVPAGVSRFVPVAISCNFDRELENALATLGRSFHVVFPVRYHCEEAGRTKWETGWILRTLTSTKPGVPHEDRLLDKSVAGGDLAVDRNQLIGPLVVKLHGSPLDELPQLSTLEAIRLSRPLSRPEVRRVEHKLVFADHQILADAISGAEPLPPGLLDLLRDESPDGPRMVCFLGFPLRDPNSRLRVLRTLESVPAAFLQEHPADLLRSGFLLRLPKKVRYFTEQLDKVARIIGDGLGTATGPRAKGAGA